MGEGPCLHEEGQFCGVIGGRRWRTLGHCPLCFRGIGLVEAARGSIGEMELESPRDMMRRHSQKIE